MELKLKFLCFLLFFPFFFSLNSFKFIAISDFHVGSKNSSFFNGLDYAAYEDKYFIRDRILDYISENDIDLVLMVGDLTENGLKEEWKEFACEWIKPIAQIIGIEKIGLCVGNHDAGCPPWYYELKSGTIYENFYNIERIFHTFVLNDVQFICCGIYPNKDIRTELENLLTTIDFQIPIIIFFHYSIFQNCNRMNNEVRNEFYEIIKNHNVIGIINGHKHNSFVETWNKIPVFWCWRF